MIKEFNLSAKIFKDPEMGICDWAIQEEVKEDFKKLMNWTEEEFMSHVFVRLKNKRSFR